MNERAFLAQLESANTEELGQILRRPNADEERLLEVYFGAERLQRLRGLALTTQKARRGITAPRGNVVVLHGIMGGELTVYPNPQSSQFIWMNIPRLAIGAVGWLRMTPDFHSQFNIQATGIIKKYYAEQILGLTNDGWNVKAFWYDWRQNLTGIADNLRQQIDGWFGPQAAVNLVAHSMGGLVSRTYIANHADRWKRGGRLIMLGTPNHGSFAIPQVITGAYDTIRKLALLDLTHNLRDLCAILNGFPGSMQMLPSHLQMPAMERMYHAAQWSSWGVLQSILDVARASHERLAKIVDGDRMSYIAGCNQLTKVGVNDWNRLDHADAYTDSMEGDGTVPHALGFLRDGTTRIPTYFVECSHGALPNRSDVITATDQLLATGKCNLPTSIPARRAVAAIKRSVVAKRAQETAEEETLRELSRRVRARSRAVGDVHDAPVSADEILAGKILVRSFLEDESGIAAAPAAAPPSPPQPVAAISTTPKKAPLSITISIVHGGIEQNDGPLAKADAISVGHYLGVAPQFAELAIDRAISAKITEKNPKADSKNELLITSLCRRGVIVGELGQNYVLPDPRKEGRVIIIAGMGRPGMFREAELAVLTRELIWSLGRSGKKYLFTVLIGAGAGNLETQDAVRAWLRGIRRALYDAQSHSEPRLRSVTFVEFNEANLLRLHTALQNGVETFANDPEGPLRISYSAPDKTALRRLRKAAERKTAQRAVAEVRKSFTALTGSGPDPEPIRLTIQLQADTFQFAALTAEASVPERDTRIDPALVEEANDQLPSAESFAKQMDHGNLLSRLLLPDDMRDMIFRQSAPIVLALDATTARIHWEMMADQAAGTTTDFAPEHFLGTLYGLTRQLRTTFAQLPEPPILSGRALRVLVVADPDEDAPLPGAQEEGEAVAAIFEEFGRDPVRQVEVVRLFGPGQATRVAVLDQLINHRFDMMHYAGHCFFNEK
ncbi:MAG: CHAT domain-containing protein, partial [Chthoniobacterales bacterium]